MEKIYNEIISDKEMPFQFEYVPNHSIKYLKLKKHDFPWSIVSKEFSFIFETITSNGLKRGFEACTGLGLSALAAGMAMKVTDGKVITLDAYVEEFLNTYIYSSDMKKIINEDSDGFKNIQYIIKKYKLEKTLIAEIGWSPDDISKTIEKHFTDKLDYIFIDSGHTEEQLFKEIQAFLPYTNQDTIWLFHDIIPTLWTPKIENFCNKNLRKKMSIKLSSNQGCSNLGILEKYE